MGVQDLRLCVLAERRVLHLYLCRLLAYLPVIDWARDGDTGSAAAADGDAPSPSLPSLAVPVSRVLEHSRGDGAVEDLDLLHDGFGLNGGGGDGYNAVLVCDALAEDEDGDDLRQRNDSCCAQVEEDAFQTVVLEALSPLLDPLDRRCLKLSGGLWLDSWPLGFCAAVVPFK